MAVKSVPCLTFSENPGVGAWPYESGSSLPLGDFLNGGLFGYNRLSMNSVLVIDDERNIRSLISRVLGQENIEVHMAATGKEGLELAERP